MDPTPEQEQPEKKVVKLEQEFLLFDPNRTGIGKHKGEPRIFITSILLDTDLLPEIPIDIKASNFPEFRYRVITPFTPEEGYRITNEDLDPKSRVEKWKRVVQSKLMDFVDMEKAPLVLYIIAYTRNLIELELIYKRPDPLKPHLPPSIIVFKPEAKALLQRLRLQLFFPNSAFEAKAHLSDEISFEQFYPLDTGPLPEAPYMELNQHTPEGYHLQLPSNPEKLSQIRARFILANQENEEAREEKKIEIPEAFRKAFENQD